MTGRWLLFDTGDVPRAGLCDGKATALVGGAPGEIRLNNCCRLGGTGGGVGGVDDVHLGNVGGGKSPIVDGHGDGEY